MACCCPNLFKRKKKHTFNPELDVQIEVNQAPKIIIKNDTEVEIEMGKRTSLENMNCSLNGSIDEPLESRMNNAGKLSIDTQLTQEIEAKEERELTFEEEVYKELENTENGEDFKIKIELQGEKSDEEMIQYTEPIIEVTKIEEKSEPKMEPKLESEPNSNPNIELKSEAEHEKPEEIRISKPEIKAQNRVSLSMLPSLDLPESPSSKSDQKMGQELEPITELKSENENPDEIPIPKSETLDSKRSSLSMLPSLDVTEPLPDVPELQNQTSLENPNYLETEEPGFFSAELNPLESNFRSSVKLLVMGDK